MKLLLTLLTCITFMSCNNNAATGDGASSKDSGSNTSSGGDGATARNNVQYTEGKDYQVYDRIRIMDNKGFTEPAEAFSLLLPKGWQHQAEIIWNAPGTNCSGIFGWLKAQSADGKYSMEVFPDLVLSWNDDPYLQQFNQQHQDPSSNCSFAQPIDAENYLRKMFASKELGNAEVVSVEANPIVVQQMAQNNEKTRNEMMQYGSGGMNFYQTAVNAVVRWPNKVEGLVVLGVTIMEGIVPNPYNGTSSKIYTTGITKRTVFKYPAGEAEQAKNQFAVIMGSVRTNPAWQNAVNDFWKAARQQSHSVHVGKIKLMDEQTRQIGERAIQKGNERLQQMDTQMRNWEAQQNSQDRMHTNFIKTIREVENFRDETGTYEMTSSYNHAWSRGDGTSFVMSNNPNFDPGFVFKDQAWKQMKKVD